MMNRSKSPDMQVLKYLLAAPAITGLLLLTGFTQAKEKPELAAVVTNHTQPEVALAAPDPQAMPVDQEIADISRTTSTTTATVAPPVPPAPPALPQPGSNPSTEPIDPDRNTTISITEELVDGKVTKTATKIEAKNVKYLTIGTDPENSENTKVQSSAITTSFKKGDYIIYLDGARFYKSLTELNAKAIKSMSILSGQHAVDFDAKLSIDDKIIVIETNKELKNSQPSPAQPFQVFPNPATSYWTVKTAQPGSGDRYELFDRDGSKKASGKLEQTTQINAVKFPEGIYFLKLYIAGKSYQTRLTKQAN